MLKEFSYEKCSPSFQPDRLSRMSSPLPSLPPLRIRKAAQNDADKAIVAGIRKSRVDWLNSVKDTPEQWGKESWSEEELEYYIGLGLYIVEIDNLTDKPGPAPVAIYVLGERMPYVPKDPNLPEGQVEDTNNELYLTSLVVHRDARGLGIGERLIEMAKQKARELEKEWLRLDCYRGVKKGGVLRNGLVKYYEARGFKCVRPFDFWLDSRNFSWPGMLMEMRIQQGLPQVAGVDDD